MKTKNRLLTGVLCVLMVVCFIVGFSACGRDDKCSHQWGEWITTTNATCTEAGIQERKCSKCGETETSAINALGHDWNEATCFTPKTCKTCSATEGTANAHAYTVETVKDEALKSAANCMGAAVYYKSCSCGTISTNDADTFTSGEALEHKDENHDHICDYGCGKNDIGAHADSPTDNDHLCDYGCGAVLEECSDADGDGDHACDVCGKANITGCNFSAATCTAPATCSECGATKGTALSHKDENHDHICDYGCGKNDIGAHADSPTDNDHLCDYGCGAVLENCSDADGDGDHACDVCGKANITGCNFSAATCTAPATCSECGATTGTALSHKDENHDHICDYGCGKNDIGAHADSPTDNDHLCDYGCGAVLEECFDTNTDNDHDCDICGKANVTLHQQWY